MSQEEWSGSYRTIQQIFTGPYLSGDRMGVEDENDTDSDCLSNEMTKSLEMGKADIMSDDSEMKWRQARGTLRLYNDSILALVHRLVYHQISSEHHDSSSSDKEPPEQCAYHPQWRPFALDLTFPFWKIWPWFDIWPVHFCTGDIWQADSTAKKPFVQSRQWRHHCRIYKQMFLTGS